ncbi:MAG TPA: hypothetical protein VE553_08415 [Candidatus Binatia bacterium]|nr:hypothetical protein [Candidatus Binatia bacterium]
MNRFWTILLLISLLLLTACGGQEEPPAAGATVDAPEVPTEEAQTVEVTRVDSEAPTLPPPVVEGEQPGAEAPPTPETPSEGEQPGAEAQPTPVFPWPEDRFGYGVQIHGNATVGDPAQVADTVANQLGMDWVKVQLKWPVVHPDPETEQWFFYDGVIDEAYAHGLNVLISVVGAPAWTRAAGGENGPPDDYNLYVEFLKEALSRYEGKVQAVEVWNEQNLDREWTTPNGISPEDYVRFLELAYNAIKEQDSNIIVVSGALSPTGDGDWVRWADDFAYLERALAAGMLNYADCVGAHHNGINLPPDVSFDEAGNLAEAATAEFRGPFDNPHHSWSFKTTLDTYAEMVQAVDPDMKLCVTEFGWASSEGYDAVPEGFGFALDNSLEEQAAYIVQAFQQMHDSGNVWLAFLFNFDYGNKGNGPTDDTVPYSIVDVNGVPRPAFGALAEMEKAP